MHHIVDKACKAFILSLSKRSRYVSAKHFYHSNVAKKPVQSYSQLLVSIREILRQYEQKAQLSSSHPIVRYYNRHWRYDLQHKFAGYGASVYPMTMTEEHIPLILLFCNLVT